MFPERLLADIPWSFNESTFESLDEFVKSVSEYHVALDLSGDWKADDIAVKAQKLNVITEEVYDENEEEVDLSFDIVSDGDAFTNGELLFKLHNLYAEKIAAGYEFGDHCFFEGLSFADGSECQYNCYLGS